MGKTYEKVVRGGLVALANGLENVDIGISNGRITAIAEDKSLQGETILDAADQIVIPGAIDIHVHFREPGFTHKEDFAHGTAAAACGGFTVICDMPNTQPPTTTIQAFLEKDALVARKAYIDYGLWAGGKRLDEFQGLFDEGAVGLKIYMVGGHTYKDEVPIHDDTTLLNVLRASARLGWLVSVHVGNDEISAIHRKALQEAGRKDPAAFMEFIHDFSAVEGLYRILVLAREAEARIHIAHIAVFGTELIDIIDDFRKKGLQVSTEIDPPCLTYEDLDRLGTFALPFVLTPEDQITFWRAVADGRVDVLATDHAPHTKEEKEPGTKNVWEAPNGFPAIETSLAIAFDAVSKGHLTLGQMVSAVSTKPARLLGLKNKGQIAIGRDADLVFIDPNKGWTVDENKLHSKVGWSPFHGKRFTGRVTRTILRGEVIAQDREIVCEQPMGRRVSPQYAFQTNRE